MINRQLPVNIEAEQSLLGAILLDEVQLDDCSSLVKTNDFYDAKHELIYKAMLELRATQTPIDLVTITNHLQNKQLLIAAGKTSYIASLPGYVSSPSLAGEYAKIVKEKALRRQVIRLAGEAVERAYQAEDMGEVVNGLEQDIFTLTNKLPNKNMVLASEVAPDLLEDIFERTEKQGMTGYPWMLEKLNFYTSGLHKGNLIIIAASTGVGKTSFAIQQATHLAVNSNLPVVYFSLEMTNLEILERAAVQLAGVDGQAVKAGRLTQNNTRAKLTEAIDKISKSKFFILDKAGITVSDVRNECKRIRLREGKLGCIVVDYLQLMKPEQRGANRNLEIGTITMGLKILASELSTPIILLSQFNRGVYGNPDKRPTLANLRDSGSIEQDSDVVLLLSRKDEEETAPIKKVLIDIAKQRNGPTATTYINWYGSIMSFKDV